MSQKNYRKVIFFITIFIFAIALIYLFISKSSNIKAELAQLGNAITIKSYEYDKKTNSIILLGVSLNTSNTKDLESVSSKYKPKLEKLYNTWPNSTATAKKIILEFKEESNLPNKITLEDLAVRTNNFEDFPETSSSSQINKFEITVLNNLDSFMQEGKDFEASINITNASGAYKLPEFDPLSSITIEEISAGRIDLNEEIFGIIASFDHRFSELIAFGKNAVISDYFEKNRTYKLGNILSGSIEYFASKNISQEGILFSNGRNFYFNIFSYDVKIQKLASEKMFYPPNDGTTPTASIAGFDIKNYIIEGLEISQNDKKIMSASNITSDISLSKHLVSAKFNLKDVSLNLKTLSVFNIPSEVYNFFPGMEANSDIYLNMSSTEEEDNSLNLETELCITEKILGSLNIKSNITLQQSLEAILLSPYPPSIQTINGLELKMEDKGMIDLLSIFMSKDLGTTPEAARKQFALTLPGLITLHYGDFDSVKTLAANIAAFINDKGKLEIKIIGNKNTSNFDELFFEATEGKDGASISSKHSN